MQHRLWTSDRRARHGLQDHPSACCTCNRDEDNVEHILIKCGYARGVWEGCLDHLNLATARPIHEDTFLEWWLHARANFHKADKRGFDTFTLAVAWSLWKQRNARVFDRASQVKTMQELKTMIINELAEWKRAGVGVGGLSRFVRE